MERLNQVLLLQRFLLSLQASIALSCHPSFSPSIQPFYPQVSTTEPTVVPKNVSSSVSPATYERSAYFDVSQALLGTNGDILKIESGSKTFKVTVVESMTGTQLSAVTITCYQRKGTKRSSTQNQS